MKKMLSLLLAIVMLMTLVPMGVFAADTTTTKVDIGDTYADEYADLTTLATTYPSALQVSKDESDHITIKLLSDVTGRIELAIPNAGFTLDANGKTFSGGEENEALGIVYGKNCTLYVIGNGTFTSGKHNTICVNSGTMYVESATISGNIVTYGVAKAVLADGKTCFSVKINDNAPAIYTSEQELRCGKEDTVVVTQLDAIPHPHPICGANCTHSGAHTSLDWTAWEGDSFLPSESGNYYLTQDVTLDAYWAIDEDINICLNGHTISKDDNIICFVGDDVNFSITDCRTEGKVYVPGNVVSFEGDNSTVNLYNGTLVSDDANTVIDTESTGNVFNIYGGCIKNEADSAAIAARYATVNLYGGEIYAAEDCAVRVRINGIINLCGNTKLSHGEGFDNIVCLDTSRIDASGYTGEALTIHYKTESLQVGDVIVINVTDDTADKFALSGTENAGYVLKREGNNLVVAEIVTTYKVTFDANGGTGTMAAVSGVTGEYTLPECTFTAPDGKQFKAWSVDSSEKAVGEKITVTTDTTVKAIWEEIVNDDNTDPEYYLVGWINNDDCYEEEYKFVDGKIEFKFTSDSYVAVMDSEENIYWTDGWLDFDPTEATLKRSGDNKMHISPKSDNRTLWLTVNDDGTLTLSTVEPAPTYKVTFDANGGTVDPASAKTNEDGKLASLPTPTRSDYTFNGWYTASSDGVQVTAETVFEADTTIYAQWSYNGSIGGSTGGGGVSKYTVKFNTNGGTKVANKTVKKNTILAEPAAPTKDGYTFDGWYTDKNFTNAYNFDKKVTKSITLYAKWVEVKPTHSCTFDSFNDLDDTKWYHEDIEYVLENKIMLGVSDTAFAPDESLTRGMLVTILYRSEGEPATNKSIPFADVDMGAYYANAASWAQQNGIVNGISDTEFAPDMNVTREQLATIMYRYACLKGMDAVTLEENLNFNDATDVSEWAVTAMNWGVGRNYIFSRNAGSIAPNDAATRAEVAAFIHRYVENIVK